MRANKQSAVLFQKGQGLPPRQAVEDALQDLSPKLQWLEEHETEVSRALSVHLGDQQLAVTLWGQPLAPELYQEMLTDSGLQAEDQEQIANHGSHVRIVSMKSEAVAEPVERMGLVYRVAARLASLDGLAVLAPGSGVFVCGLLPEHVDTPLSQEVPPLDLWVQVEMHGDDEAKTQGTTLLGLPELELHGVGLLPPEAIFATTMDVLLYLRRIRRDFVPGETMHVGRQPWQWVADKCTTGQVILRRQPLPQAVNAPQS
jgi:hypothetical protein